MPLHYWQLRSQLQALLTSLINLNLKFKGVVIKLVCLWEGGEKKPKIITIVSWGKMSKLIASRWFNSLL